MHRASTVCCRTSQPSRGAPLALLHRRSILTAAGLHGTFAPLTTPFVNGEVDYVGLARNAEYYLQSKLTGLVILGSTGEVRASVFVFFVRPLLRLTRTHSHLLAVSVTYYG